MKLPAYLDIALHAARTSEGNRAELQLALDLERRDLPAVWADIHLLVRDAKVKARTVAGERFHEHYRPAVHRLTQSLRETLPTWRGNLSRRTQRFQEWAEGALHDELGGLSEHGAGYLAPVIADTRDSLFRHVAVFQDRLALHIEKALGTHFQGAKFNLTLDTPERPDIHIGHIFDTHVDLLLFLIPMRVFHALFERHFVRMIPWQVEKNLSRLGTQWAEAAGTLLDEAAAQALRAVEDELTTVQALVLRTASNSAHIEQSLRQLTELEVSLQATDKEEVVL